MTVNGILANKTLPEVAVTELVGRISIEPPTTLNVLQFSQFVTSFPGNKLDDPAVLIAVSVPVAGKPFPPVPV
jgi:hypothetical protein